MATVRNERVPLSRIRVDGGTQTRMYINDRTVNEYAEAYRRGDEMPPVVLFDDGTNLWMADGFHRLAASEAAGLTEIAVVVREGTVREALLYSAGCNCTHGLPRSTFDKRHAVGLLLADPEWAARSNVWIAEQCRVSDHLVANEREQLARVSNSRETPRRKGRDGRTYKARKPRRARAAKSQTGKPATDREETVEAAIERTSSAIESFCRKLMAFVEAEMPDGDPWLARDNRRGGAIQKIEFACSQLRSVKCAHVCPICSGAKKRADGGTCDPCLGTGRMPKAFYDQAV
jgi:hypothetical protein